MNVGRRCVLVDSRRRCRASDFILKCRAPSWISIDQPEGAVMQTRSGRLTAVRGVLLLAVLCVSPNGFFGRGRNRDRVFWIVHNPPPPRKALSVDGPGHKRGQNNPT